MEIMQDMDDPDQYASTFKKELQKFGVQFRIFREITPQEIAQTQMVSKANHKKYDFKLGGKFYVFDSWKPLGI